MEKFLLANGFIKGESKKGYVTFENKNCNIEVITEHISSKKLYRITIRIPNDINGELFFNENPHNFYLMKILILKIIL
jgi:hypothetical protein